MIKNLVRGLLLTSALIAGFNLPRTLAAPNQPTAKGSSSLRDARYCEIVLTIGTMTAPTTTVYSTIGLNQCPEAQWKALNPTKLQQENHALGIEMNGPRHFMVDSISISKVGAVVSFDGLKMRRLASIDMSSGSLNRTPYTQNTIVRTTTYVYLHGKPYYELLTPDGHTYVLQSYSLIVAPRLTAASLPTLASHLTLPAGWRYRTVTPSHDLVLKSTNGKAIVIQDSLNNTYQLVQ